MIAASYVLPAKSDEQGCRDMVIAKLTYLHDEVVSCSPFYKIQQERQHVKTLSVLSSEQVLDPHGLAKLVESLGLHSQVPR